MARSVLPTTSGGSCSAGECLDPREIDAPLAILRITVQQDSDPAQALLAAQQRAYDIGQNWHRFQVSGAVLMAGAGVVVTYWAHGAGAILAAIAGLWIFVGGILSSPRERHWFTVGARIQEQFDCALFGLNWNGPLAGDHVCAEDVADLARGRSSDDLKGWYPQIIDDYPAPTNVILCQRTNAAWGRRTHAAYSTFLACAITAWFCVLVLIGLAESVELSEFLIWLALPSLPAMLEALDVFISHRDISAGKEHLQKEADMLLRSGDADPRDLQDGIFDSRRRPPKVPNWFYRLRRDKDELSAAEAVEAIASRLKLQKAE